MYFTNGSFMHACSLFLLNNAYSLPITHIILSIYPFPRNYSTPYLVSQFKKFSTII